MLKPRKSKIEIEEKQELVQVKNVNKLFEYSAHFRYKDLFQRLENFLKENPHRKVETIEFKNIKKKSSFKIQFNDSNPLNQEKVSFDSYKTRNMDLKIEKDKSNIQQTNNPRSYNSNKNSLNNIYYTKDSKVLTKIDIERSSTSLLKHNEKLYNLMKIKEIEKSSGVIRLKKQPINNQMNNLNSNSSSNLLQKYLNPGPRFVIKGKNLKF